MQSFVLSLPFLVMKWLASHTKQPWFFLFCWPLDCWESTSRVFVLDCCSSASDCCAKNLSSILWPQTGMSLPASTFFWGTSHSFCPLQPQRQQNAGCRPETARLGDDLLQQTRDPHYMLWIQWLSPLKAMTICWLIKIAHLKIKYGLKLQGFIRELRSNCKIRPNKSELWN